MRYCTACRRFTAGDPMFCGTCGRTYNVRLCPRQHANPRGADVCSQCGSRELTQPQPRSAAELRLARAALSLAFPAVLMLSSVWLLLAFVQLLLSGGELQGRLLVPLFWLGLGWLLYTRLPAGFRRAAGWGWRAARKLTGKS